MSLQRKISWFHFGVILVSLQKLITVNGQSECNYGSDAFSSLFQRNVPQTCFVMEEDGRNRCYYSYVPDCADGSTPVVFDLHGLGACPTRVGFQNQWMSKADEECIIIVYPVGNTLNDSTFDRPCWHVPGGLNLPPAPAGGAKTFPCCCQINFFPAVSSETYDLLFLRRAMIMLSELIPIETNAKVFINPKRIYMAGHSNGCVTSLSMATVHSDVVAAVCCTGGVSVTPAPDNYIATPQLTVRGRLDNQVQYAGLFIEGIGLGIPDAQAAFEHTSTLNGCTGVKSSSVLVPEMDLGSTLGSMVTQTSEGCNATVQIVTFNTAGHQTLKNATEIFPPGAANTTVDITSMLWDFCSQFEKAEIADDLRNATLPSIQPSVLLSTTTSPSQQPSKTPPSIPPTSSFPLASNPPTQSPTVLTTQPPTNSPTQVVMTRSPTKNPTMMSNPTKIPTMMSNPTKIPTRMQSPTRRPSKDPTAAPTRQIESSPAPTNSQSENIFVMTMVPTNNMMRGMMRAIL